MANDPSNPCTAVRLSLCPWIHLADIVLGLEEIRQTLFLGGSSLVHHRDWTCIQPLDAGSRQLPTTAPKLRFYRSRTIIQSLQPPPTPTRQMEYIPGSECATSSSSTDVVSATTTSEHLRAADGRTCTSKCAGGTTWRSEDRRAVSRQSRLPLSCRS